MMQVFAEAYYDYRVKAAIRQCTKQHTGREQRCFSDVGNRESDSIRQWENRMAGKKRERKRPSKSEGQDGFLQRLGPGLITGASDDDPSGIGTYSQAGAQLGFSVGWTMLMTYPLMAAIQEISGRIGRVTGHGIAGNVCRNYPLRLSGR
jgi:Natural resistance-associated macrophage protein-like